MIKKTAGSVELLMFCSITSNTSRRSGWITDSRTRERDDDAVRNLPYCHENCDHSQDDSQYHPHSPQCLTTCRTQSEKDRLKARSTTDTPRSSVGLRGRATCLRCGHAGKKTIVRIARSRCNLRNPMKLEVCESTHLHHDTLNEYQTNGHPLPLGQSVVRDDGERL